MRRAHRKRYDPLLDRDIAVAAHNRLAFEAELLGENRIADYLRLHARVISALASAIDDKLAAGAEQ